MSTRLLEYVVLIAIKCLIKKDNLIRFVCVLALVRDAHDPQPLLAEGTWHGRILRERRGDDGFGYDPVFFSPAHGSSAAELPATIKGRDSHRGLALAKLRALLLA